MAWYTGIVTALNNVGITTGTPITSANGSISLFNLQGCAVNQSPPTYPATRTLIQPAIAQQIAYNYTISFAKVFLAGNSKYLPFLSKKYMLTNSLLRTNVIYYDGCSTTTAGTVPPCSTVLPGVTPTCCYPPCATSAPQPACCTTSADAEKEEDNIACEAA